MTGYSQFTEEDEDALIEKLLMISDDHERQIELSARCNGHPEVYERVVARLSGQLVKTRVVIEDIIEMAEVTDQYEEALRNTPNVLLFQAGERLVTVAEQAETIHVLNRATMKLEKKEHIATGMVKQTSERIDDMISRNICTIYKTKAVNGSTQSNVRSTAPREVSRNICGRVGQWKYPHLSGLLSTPSIRKDGTLITTPGYDEKTNMYLTSDATWTGIGDEINRVLDTADDLQAFAKRILNKLRILFDEFPFYDVETDTCSISATKDPTTGVAPMTLSETVMLAELFTSIARAAFDVVPGFVTNAPDFGVGKTYLAECIIQLRTGKVPPTLLWSPSNEENNKLLATCLFGGWQHVLLDNVNGPIKNTLLAQMITSKYPTPRELGKNELITTPQACVVHINGVNVRPSDDLSRRLLHKTLDAKRENPKHRVFTKNPRALIAENRRTYVTQILAILSAYVRAGFPMKSRTLAGFEDWSRLIVGALTWLECPDPVDTQKRIEGGDDMLEAYAQFIEALFLRFGQNSFKVGEILAAAQGDTGTGIPGDVSIKEALMTLCDERGALLPSAQKVGRMLKDRADRIVDGKALRMGKKDSHNKQNTWRVSTG